MSQPKVEYYQVPRRMSTDERNALRAAIVNESMDSDPSITAKVRIGGKIFQVAGNERFDFVDGKITKIIKE